MAYKIIYSIESIDSIDDVAHYIESEWSEKTAEKFVSKLNEHLKMLASGVCLVTLPEKKEFTLSLLQSTTGSIICLPLMKSYY